MMETIREKSVTIRTASKMSAEELSGKIVIGEFMKKMRLSTEEYAKIIEKAQGRI